MESRKQSLRLHREYGRKIQTACKTYDGAKLSRILSILGDEFCEDFEDLLRGNIERAAEAGAKEAQHIVDMMLPKGVKPPGEPQAPDFWTREYKGTTPEVRFARFHLNLRRKLNSVTTLRLVEAPPLSAIISGQDVVDEEIYAQVAEQIWSGNIENAVGLMSSQDVWAGGALAYAATLEDNNSVIDHWEHLATLDATTCAECAALDGTVIDIGGGDVEEEPWELVDIHPNCRCVPVPVSKTWAELGEELGIEEWKDIPEPEGTRIARTDEKGQASPTGFRDPQGNYHEWVPKLDAEGHLVGDNWQPGWTPEGGNQYYVPAETRYMDWAAENPNYAGDWFIPPEPEGGVPSGGGPDWEPPSGLTDAEATTTNYKNEKGFILDANGNVLVEQRGGPTSVRWSYRDIRKMEDGILTHNHPFNAKASGGSFSAADYRACTSGNARVFRAVESNVPEGLDRHAYTLIRPEGGWPEDFKGFRVNTELNGIFNDLKPNMLESVRRGEVSPEQGVQDLSHRAWEILSEKYGFGYKREVI